MGNVNALWRCSPGRPLRYTYSIHIDICPGPTSRLTAFFTTSIEKPAKEI